MVFASTIFLFYFLPLFLVIYYLAPRRARSLIIALASYLFYGWWRPDFVILMLISTVVDFACGKSIVRDQDCGKTGRVWVVVSATVNLGLLAYFKYANFGIDTLNAALAPFQLGSLEWAEVVLPVGISFYTFQTLSYTIDVYRGTSQPVRGFTDFMCYVAMFPQLVAGPIVRYNTIAEQLHSRTHTGGKFYRGVLAFQAGLAKKVLIADMLAPVADRAFSMPELGLFDAWVGILAYTFQIYFDFSGYSDMAIGLGLMMGFRLPINFNRPYHAISITDFWRRWHISLSAFLRDYLYVPLGGNRKGPIRTYVNLAATMLLGGLWHGANWTFIAWGAYQGFWLIVERLGGKRPFYSRVPQSVQIGLTFIVVIFGWVLFRAESITHAVSYAGSMLGVHGVEMGTALVVEPLHIVAAVTAAVIVWGFPTTQTLVTRAAPQFAVAIQGAFLLALAQTHYADHVPFLYFQF
ncbi:MAG: MBOAT family protein [bacterium]|nr:MBOAT family protein [bacterium]